MDWELWLSELVGSLGLLSSDVGSSASEEQAVEEVSENGVLEPSSSVARYSG